MISVLNREINIAQGNIARLGNSNAKYVFDEKGMCLSSRHLDRRTHDDVRRLAGESDVAVWLRMRGRRQTTSTRRHHRCGRR